MQDKFIYACSKEPVSVESIEPIAPTPVYQYGLQTQTGRVPYVITKEYLINIKDQLQANIAMDNEQQEQIDELISRINDLDITIEESQGTVTTSHKVINNNFAEDRTAVISLVKGRGLSFNQLLNPSEFKFYEDDEVRPDENGIITGKYTN